MQAVIKWSSCVTLAVVLALGAGCREEAAPGPVERAAEPSPKASSPAKPKAPRTPAPPPLTMPVPFWKAGKSMGEVDAALAGTRGYLVLDLGEAWTPYIFTEGVNDQGEEAPNAYRKTYLALARGEFPDDYHGDRARDDKYLELFGIMPTVGLMRERFRATAKLTCADDLDLQPLIEFEGLITYRSNDKAKKDAKEFLYLHKQVERMVRAQKVDGPDAVRVEDLERRDRDRFKRYQDAAPDWYAMAATQDRLKCEGYTKGRGRLTRGALDWGTHESLAEFERRHRVYSWGYLGRDTLKYLRMTPMETERDAVLRVLTERAMHALGAIEDGSTSTLRDDIPRTFKGIDGKDHPVPNLEAELRERIEKSFGLTTPEATLAWLEGLGELAPNEHYYVAIEGPELPEYYDGDMDLTLDYDRGDVWYDFPYDEQGKERPQPVQRRPRVTISTRYNGQKIPLARLGTTIGGWRSEQVGDTVMWSYKESPVGRRVWERIVASPVWLPPDSTPPKDMLARRTHRKPGEPKYAVNYHETGPSYASAYGLVAAYHKKFLKRADGTYLIGADEGIRTHGSVDYMSIMRRHSHGCHRLHNHIAVRLMSFVLAHRPHQRKGQQPLAFKKTIVYEDQEYEMDIKQGGYIFELDTPLEVEVHEGRIRGKLKAPVEVPIPKFDPDAGAYVSPDGGGAVQLRGDKLVPVPMPVRDGGAPLIDPWGDPQAMLRN